MFNVIKYQLKRNRSEMGFGLHSKKNLNHTKKKMLSVTTLKVGRSKQNVGVWHFAKVNEYDQLAWSEVLRI